MTDKKITLPDIEEYKNVVKKMESLKNNYEKNGYSVNVYVQDYGNLYVRFVVKGDDIHSIKMFSRESINKE